jgi:hypothetical protein
MERVPDDRNVARPAPPADWARRLSPPNRTEDRRRLVESLEPRMRELVEAWDRR